MDEQDPALWLVKHPRFKWQDGMLDRLGARLVLDQWKHPAVTVPEVSSGLNLSDPATAGVLLAILDAENAVTDIVRDPEGWIVAIREGNELAGYLAETLGEAAAWALLAWWGEDLGFVCDVEVA